MAVDGARVLGQPEIGEASGIGDLLRLWLCHAHAHVHVVVVSVGQGCWQCCEDCRGYQEPGGRCDECWHSRDRVPLAPIKLGLATKLYARVVLR